MTTRLHPLAALAAAVLTWLGDSDDPPPHPDDERMRVEDGGPG